jgi:hypothetical protein
MPYPIKGVDRSKICGTGEFPRVTAPMPCNQAADKLALLKGMAFRPYITALQAADKLAFVKGTAFRPYITAV